LVEWNHLSYWSTQSDGLVHPEAHFLNHFFIINIKGLSNQEKDLETGVTPEIINPATQKIKRPAISAGQKLFQHPR